jgi:phage tail-like protein
MDADDIHKDDELEDSAEELSSEELEQNRAKREAQRKADAAKENAEEKKKEAEEAKEAYEAAAREAEENPSPEADAEADRLKVIKERAESRAEKAEEEAVAAEKELTDLTEPEPEPEPEEEKGIDEPPPQSFERNWKTSETPSSQLDRLELPFLSSGEYYPPSAFHFRVDFLMFPSPSGFGFKSVSGIEYDMETETINEGGLNTYSYTVPGKISHGTLKLERGAVKTGLATPLILWCKSVLEGGVDGFIVTTVVNVSLLDEMGLPNMIWSFFDAYPVGWSMGTLDSMDDGEVLLESIELAYSFFVRLL